MFDHLHWLPLIAGIQLKVLTLIYRSHTGKLPGICVTVSACLPLPSLFVRYAHLNAMISWSRERGLLWLRHGPSQSLALRFGTNSLLRHDPLY